MDATLCQVAEFNAAEVVSTPAFEPLISTLTSTEMSLAGGGLLAVAFG